MERSSGPPPGFGWSSGALTPSGSREFKGRPRDNKTIGSIQPKLHFPRSIDKISTGARGAHQATGPKHSTCWVRRGLASIPVASRDGDFVIVPQKNACSPASSRVWWCVQMETISHNLRTPSRDYNHRWAALPTESSMQTRRGTVACGATRLGSPRRRLALLLFTAFLGACGSTQTTGGAEQVKPRPPEPRVGVPIPNDVSYTLVSSAVTPGFTRTLDVRLNRKVSEGVLRTIATQLKNSDEHTYKGTFYIMYYLPGMEVGSLAWATSHFNPDLQVRIIGVSSDQEEFLLGKTAHRAGVNRIGRWLEEGALAGVHSCPKQVLAV